MTRPRLDYEVFVMALRLRRKGILLPELEDALSEIIVQIVRLSAFVTMRRYPTYASYRDLFMDPENQLNLLVPAIKAMNKADLRKKPATVANLIITTLVNRYKNLARDHVRANERGITIVTPNFDTCGRVSDLYGERRTLHPHGKVTTNEFEH